MYAIGLNSVNHKCLASMEADHSHAGPCGFLPGTGGEGCGKKGGLGPYVSGYCVQYFLPCFSSWSFYQTFCFNWDFCSCLLWTSLTKQLICEILALSAPPPPTVQVPNFCLLSNTVTLLLHPARLVSLGINQSMLWNGAIAEIAELLGGRVEKCNKEVLDRVSLQIGLEQMKYFFTQKVT